jgi:BRCT domain type II-containing protein
LKEIQVNDEGIVETEEDKKEREENEKKIFYGKRVSTAGKLSMKAKEIQKIIETLGGKYAAIVNDKLDFVISNKEEVAKESSKIEQCKKLNIPIFDEEFLFDSEENNKKYEKDELEKYYLFKPTGEKKRKHEETEGDVEVVKNKKIRLTVKGEAAVDHDWYYSLLKQ